MNQANLIFRAKKNVALLALCQALSMTCMTVLITVAALIGNALAADKTLATLPLALLQLAVMLATIPASLLMRRIGRQMGFVVGTVIGMVGAALGTLAVFTQSFELFCTATLLLGVFSGFSGFYRFAAADAAQASFRAQAISLVIAGGVVAALMGPGLSTWAKDWFTDAVYAGSILSLVALQAVTLVLLMGIDMPPLPLSEQHQSGRSLFEISRQPVFRVAVLGSMVGYGVMIFLMTATPLAMVHINHSFGAAATVIQWHVLGMFAPSFFTGFLIARFGVLRIILSGVIFNLLCVTTALMGTSVGHFLVSMALLGVGWNFMFVGSTTLLTDAYTPAEKAKTQALHDFLMFGFVAAATFLSGRLLNDFGWAVLNYTAIPALVAVLVAVVWLQQTRRDRPSSALH